MKDKLLVFLSVMVFALLLLASLTSIGCKTPTPLTDAFGKEVNAGDVKIAGEALGEGMYLAYKFLEQDKKYDMYTDRLRKIYLALEKAQAEGDTAGLDVEAITNAALDVLAVVAAAEYGPQNAAAIKLASSIAVRYLVLFAKSRLPESQLEVFVSSVWTGVQRAKASGADLIAEPTEIDELVKLEPSEECGLVCVIDKVSSRLNAGGLSKYDEKRLKKRLKELQKRYEKEMAEIEAEVGFCGEAAD